jgi:hypothetical protein
LNDEFVELSTKLCRQPTSAAQSGTPSNFRTTRVMKELRQMSMKDHPNYDIYVSEKDFTFWKVVLAGPSDSPVSQPKGEKHADKMPACLASFMTYSQGVGELTDRFTLRF